MRLRAAFCGGSDVACVRSLQRLRKTIFIDRCGWTLQRDDDREVDQYDVASTVHLALWADDALVGTFRATRTDRPYLAADVFPLLAEDMPYPRSSDVWEVSRLGVRSGLRERELATVLYALMFRFAREAKATALVAIADLAYERFLRSLAIRTRRYGPPQIIGTDVSGRPLRAMAGEIPISEQDAGRIASLDALLSAIEITYAQDLFGHSLVSA